MTVRQTQQHRPALLEAWFELQPPAAQPTLRGLHMLVLTASPTLAVSIKWGHAVYSHSGHHLLALIPHSEHANLQVYNGAQLQVTFPELTGSGKGMRHWKQRYGLPLEAGRITALVAASVEHAAA